MAKSILVLLIEKVDLLESKSQINKNWKDYISTLETGDLETLMGENDPNLLVNQINSWMEEDEFTIERIEEPKIEEVEEEVVSEPPQKKRWLFAKKSIEFIKTIELGTAFRILLFSVVGFILYLIAVQMANDPSLLSIDFQKISGGQTIEVVQEAKPLRWDWSVFSLWWESFNSENYVHLFSAIIGIGFFANVLKDASDNASGGNWAAVVGGIAFVFAFISMSPLMAASITLMACLVQWRDRRSYQGVWVAPTLLFAISLSLNLVGKKYLGWDTENFTGLLRALFHWGYTLPVKLTWVICYPIILGFTAVMGFSPRKTLRDASGQAWIHLCLSLYAIISGVIPFTRYWGVFIIPEKISDLNGLTIFVIANAIFAFLLELKELSSGASGDREIADWVGIVTFITYVILVALIALAFTTSSFFKTPLLISIFIGMIIPTLILGIIILGKKIKGEGEGSEAAVRGMLEQDLAGFWRIGPILIPNTYVGIILVGMYICIITIGGFAEMLAKVL